MMYFHVKFHHLIEIEGFDGSPDMHSQRVANEVERVVIGEERRIFTEDRALFGRIDVRFQFRRSDFPGVTEKFGQHLEIFEVETFRKLTARKDIQGLPKEPNYG